MYMYVCTYVCCCVYEFTGVCTIHVHVCVLVYTLMQYRVMISVFDSTVDKCILVV